MNNEFSEVELVYLVKENNEDAKNTLYEKYSYIIDIILSKYKKSIYTIGMDFNEVKQEALVGFSDALIKYANDKNSSLPTFISLVVERKIQNAVRKGETLKNKVLSEAVSLEYDNDGLMRPLKEVIGDTTNDPLTNMAQKESYEELQSKIRELLSPFEHDVYKLLINGFNYLEIARILEKEPKQIDNTIQRLRTKIKDLI